MWRKENCGALLVEMQISIASIKNSMRVPQKVKNRTTIWSSNPISGYIPNRIEIRILRSYTYSHVYCSIIHNSQDIETTYMFIHKWVDKENVIYIYIFNKVLFSLKREVNQLTFLWTFWCTKYFIGSKHLLQPLSYLLLTRSCEGGVGEV